MKLTLYSISDGDNVINKSLENGLEIDINLKGDVNVTQPSFILSKIDNVLFTDFNYCYVDVLERYYFINTIDNINAKLWRLTCECDVLETYKSDILKCNARLQRNIKTGDYIDSEVEKSVLTKVSIHESSGDLGEKGSSIILTVVGG